MAAPSAGVVGTILQRDESSILKEWVQEQLAAISRAGVIQEAELRHQCSDFLRLLRDAVNTGGEAEGPVYQAVRDLLGEVSRNRGTQGFTPSETATFVFSLKKPLFARLRTELARDAGALAEETWRISDLLDRLGLYTTEVYQKTRDAVIARQQEEMLELSTPVVKLWDGIVALPMIGTLDSNRTQVVMETLLQKIVETGSQVAIIDITGVPTVDTLVAQHLLKTVAAARLMGADCIISGIRPQIAQTIVHLGIDLGDVVTRANLADAFRTALERSGAELHPGARAREA
ncbi:MAG TPA: STAS domain-containing protein [Anaeromyxobacteraceae bacterium]|nr:STAS domain-containing protein [Anaeromyxobacteraceae bacterium]